MLSGEEGLGNISVYTDMWINRVFKDFYDLVRYSISPQMMQVKNREFRKLLEKEMASNNESYNYLVNRLNALHLSIWEFKKEYQKLNSNGNIRLNFIDEYFEACQDFIKLTSLKMFKYGVQFGMELKKGKFVENFEW